MSPRKPVDNCFLIRYKACRSHGHRSCCLSKLDVLGACVSGQSLKSWDTRCEVQTFCSSKKLEAEFCAGCVTGPEVGLDANRVSVSPTQYILGFTVHLMCGSHSASFWVSFRQNCSVRGCKFRVFMRGGEFRNLLYCHLVLEPIHSLTPPFFFTSSNKMSGIVKACAISS